MPSSHPASKRPARAVRKTNKQAKAPEKTSAIEALWAACRAELVFFFKQRIPDDSQVEDLVQEVFAELADAPEESIDALSVWFIRTAVRLRQEHQLRLRSPGGRHHKSYREAVHGKVHANVNPELVCLALQAVEQLIAKSQALPERTRSVWSLYFLNGLTEEKIAARLHMDVSTVRKYLHRAQDYLSKRLEI